MLLFRDVDRNPDQVCVRSSGRPDQLAACAQPDPFAAGMSHAKSPVDRAAACMRQLACNLVELPVLRMQ
jgi:hypothetical protein